MNKKIIFSSGGTGGHLFPAIHLMKHFLDKEYNVLLVTDIRGYKFLKDFPEIKSFVINTDTPFNKNIIGSFLSFFKIFISIFKSVILLKKEKPKLIFGFGGYVSFPISFASKILRIPLVIYENNALLGKTNKYLASYAKKIFTSNRAIINLSEKYNKKIYKVGSILNKDIINYSPLRKDIAKEYFSILVLGGSQGAEIFGKTIPTVIKMIKEKGYEIEISQQCVESQLNSIKEFYELNNIKSNVFKFNKNILSFLSTSDLAISRCGASSTDELVATCVPFIAVPLPNSMDNHQHLNAKYHEKKGYCWLLEQKDFNQDSLFKLVEKIIKDKKKLRITIKLMSKFEGKNVYIDIEKEIKEFI